MRRPRRPTPSHPIVFAGCSDEGHCSLPPLLLLFFLFLFSFLFRLSFVFPSFLFAVFGGKQWRPVGAVVTEFCGVASFSCFFSLPLKLMSAVWPVKSDRHSRIQTLSLSLSFFLSLSHISAFNGFNGVSLARFKLVLPSSSNFYELVLRVDGRWVRMGIENGGKSGGGEMESKTSKPDHIFR